MEQKLTEYEVKAREIANDFLLDHFKDDDMDIVWFEYTKSIEEGDKVHVLIKEFELEAYFYIIIDKKSGDVSLKFVDPVKKETYWRDYKTA